MMDYNGDVLSYFDSFERIEISEQIILKIRDFSKKTCTIKK